jgi:hypothetical protein
MEILLLIYSVITLLVIKDQTVSQILVLVEYVKAVMAIVMEILAL